MNYPVPDLIKKLLCKSVNETREKPVLWYMLQKPGRQFVQKGVKSKEAKLISSVQCSLNSVIIEEQVERSLFSLQNESSSKKQKRSGR